MEIVHNVSALTHRHPISLIACGIYVNVALRLLKIEESLYMCVEQGKVKRLSFMTLRCLMKQIIIIG